MRKKIVIVGFGGMGAYHSQIVGKSEHLEFAGIYDISTKVMENVKKYNISTYNSLEDVLKDEQIDAILIATPNDCHKDIAIRALKAGKNVISEKPVTLSSNDLIEILECAKKESKIFTVNQNRRWDEDYLSVKEIFDTKICGEVFNIESRVHGSRGIPGDWRKIKEKGGGMLLDWGVHILDQILVMIPEKIESVYAKLSFTAKNEVDDGFRIILTFESGLNVLVEVGTINYISLPRWYIQGENATAVIEDFSVNGTIKGFVSKNEKDAKPVKTAAGLTKTMAPRSEESIVEVSLPRVESNYLEFYDNFANAIDGKEQLLIKDYELLRCMKLMETCVLSHERNEVIKFNDNYKEEYND